MCQLQYLQLTYPSGPELSHSQRMQFTSQGWWEKQRNNKHWRKAWEMLRKVRPAAHPARHSVSSCGDRSCWKSDWYFNSCPKLLGWLSCLKLHWNSGVRIAFWCLNPGVSLLFCLLDPSVAANRTPCESCWVLGILFGLRCTSLSWPFATACSNRSWMKLHIYMRCFYLLIQQIFRFGHTFDLLSGGWKTGFGASCKVYCYWWERRSLGWSIRTQTLFCKPWKPHRAEFVSIQI